MGSLVDTYNELLTDRALAAASAERLQRGQKERRLYFGDHPLSVSLRPRLVSEAEFDHAVEAAESVHGALSTLERALLEDRALRAELGLEPREERLALAEPPGGSSSPSSRLDSFTADEVRYVEYNAESPAGMAYGDVLAEVMDSLPVMERFRRLFSLRALPTRGMQVEAMLAAFRRWDASAEPAVAIVDWVGVPTVTEFELFRDFLLSQGVACTICDPASLRYRKGRLTTSSGEPVNLVYRRVLTSELLSVDGESNAMCRAYLDGAAVVVNSFRAKLLHKKMSLALLSDERYEHLYSADELEAVRRHVPWTRRLAEGASSWNGDKVDDLVAFVRGRRSSMVLKPNDEYGGKGVVLGWTVSDSEWASALAAALRQICVVQEAVPVPRETFPLVTGGVVDLVDMAVDMDPYLYEGKVGGALVRLSSSALLNVTAGDGSVVPTYVVEGVHASDTGVVS